MPPDEPPAPPTIPDYELIRLVGRGSYGDVWLARGVTGVFRAIKIVWRARFPDAQPYEREFRGLKEFAAVSLLESRQLALLHVSRHEADGFFYYVMELADDVDTGRDVDPARYVPHTLKEVRVRRGRMPAPEVVALGAEIARALAGLHSRGLVHRDIKPSNIILVGGAPKLADIGLVAAASAGLTFVGTEGYVPPEGPGAPTADVFALGKLLYEFATGLDRQDYPRLPPELHALPDRKELLELNEVLIRACEPAADKRHRDASALLEDLLLLQAGKSVRRLRAAERRLGRALRMAVALAIVAAVAGMGAWVAQQRADREMRLRAQAEAERDSLRQRATYSANLARAQRAIDNGDLLRAQQLLEDIRPKEHEKDLRGFEWHALWHEAQGDPRTEVRHAGAEAVSLALAPDESALAVHDRADLVSVYDTATLQPTLRVAGVGKLAGFSADGKWLVGSDSGGFVQRWAATSGHKDEGATPAIGAPVAAIGADAVLAISDGATAALRGWDFGARKETLRLDLGAQDPAAPWIAFRSGASADGQVIVQAWRKGTGSASQFKLTCIRLGPSPDVRQRETGRAVPNAIGVDRLGAWAFFDSGDPALKGRIWRCGAAGWEETTGEHLPHDTRKYVEYDGGRGPIGLAMRVRQLAWLEQPQSDAIVSTAHGHGPLIVDLVVAPKHRQVFSAATDGAVLRWGLDGPAPRSFRGWDSLGGTTNLVFAADGRSVWVPLDGVSCVRLDIATLAPLARAEGMVYPVSLAGDVLIGVGTAPGLVRVDARTGTLIDRTMVSGAPARVAAASTDGREMAVIDHAGTLLALDHSTPRRLKEGLHRHYRIALTAEGHHLLTANSTTRELLCLAWPEGREVWRKTLPALASDFLIMPDGRHVVVALENGMLEYRRMATGDIESGERRRIGELRSESAAPQAIALTPDTTRLLVAGMEGEVHCVDWATGEHIHAIPLGRGEYLHRMVCSPDGKSVGVLTRSGRLHVLRSD